jgi:hypothetical protein
MSGIINFLFGSQKRAHGSEEDPTDPSKKIPKKECAQKRAQSEDQDPSNPSTKLPKLDLNEPSSILATKLGEDEIYQLFERMSLPALAVFAETNKDFAGKVRDYLEHKAQMVITSIESTVLLMKEKGVFHADQFDIDSAQDLLSLEDGVKKDAALLENLKDLLNAISESNGDDPETFAKSLVRGLSIESMKKMFLKEVLRLTQQKLDDGAEDDYLELEDHPEYFERLFDQIHALIHHENIFTPCERFSLLSNFHRAWIKQGEHGVDLNFREVPASLKKAIKSLALNLVKTSDLTSNIASFLIQNVCKAEVFYNQDKLKNPIYLKSPQVLAHTFSAASGDLFIEPLLNDLIELLKDRNIPSSLICSVYTSLLHISQTLIDRNPGPDRRDLFLKGIVDHIDSIENRSAYFHVLADLLIILEDFGDPSIKSQMQSKVCEIVSAADQEEVRALYFCFTDRNKVNILVNSLAHNKMARVHLDLLEKAFLPFIPKVEDFEKLVNELGITSADLKILFVKDKQAILSHSTSFELIQSYLRRLENKEDAFDLFLTLLEDNTDHISRCCCYIDLFKFLLNQIPKEKQIESIEKFIAVHPSFKGFYKELVQKDLEELIFSIEDEASKLRLAPLLLSKIEDPKMFWYRRFERIGSEGSKQRLYELLKCFDQLLKYQSTPVLNMSHPFYEIYQESDDILNGLDPAEASEILFQTLLILERGQGVLFDQSTHKYIKNKILSKIYHFAEKIEDLGLKRVFLERTESQFGKPKDSFCSIQ